MEELFFENFHKNHQHENAISMDLEKINYQDLAANQGNDQKIQQRNSDLMLDMGIFLRRLELEVEKEYADFADYRFIFKKIRATFKQNSIEGVIELLDNLEELLDLGLPYLSIKKNLI